MEQIPESSTVWPENKDPWCDFYFVQPLTREQPKTVGPDGYTDQERLSILKEICLPVDGRYFLFTGRMK